MRYKTTLILLNLFFVCSILSANDFDLDRFVGKLESKIKSIKDFETEFKQTYISNSGVESDTYTGKILFKKDNELFKMRWQYKKPEKKLLVVDGKSMWLYREEDKLVNIVKNYASELEKSGIVALWKTGELKKTFTITLVSQEKDLIRLNLEPIEENKNVPKIHIWVSEKDMTIMTIAVFEPSGDINKITFTKRLKINRLLKDKIFEFVVPKGVKVFEN